MSRIIWFACCVLLLGAAAKKGYGPGEQDWAHVEVRKDAFLFWWLYYTTAAVTSFDQRPLIIWLQGGPGASSTGFGNFAELGPLDVDLQPRSFSWVKDANVLFVDNPVGTGFSYVKDGSKLARNNRQIAEDLVAMMHGFYRKLPAFEKVPLYITSESYGGKMAAEFALVLDEAVRNKSIVANLKGVLLGDAWISPIDSVMNWGPYLYYTGMVDAQGLEKINKGALRTRELVDTGRFQEATAQWGYTEQIILQQAGSVDFYNILNKISGYSMRNQENLSELFYPSIADDEVKLARLMPKVADALGIPSRWSSHNSQVFSALKPDFMKPVTHIVEKLLNTTNVKVAVVNGQLDLIVSTSGTVAWVDKLHWNGTEHYLQSSRQPIVYQGIIEGFEKSFSTFTMYWINRAGHMVPADNPSAMDHVLQQLTDNYSG